MKYNFAERLKHIKKKRELRAAFLRKPKPAKVKIEDTDVPLDVKDIKHGKD